MTEESLFDDDDYYDRAQNDYEAEIEGVVSKYAEDIKGFGDGNFGHMIMVFYDAIRRHGYADKFPAAKTRKQISAGKRMKVMEGNEYRCVLCGSHVDLTIDHIVPVVKGGTNDIKNLQTMCRSCNSKKGAK